MSEMIERVAQAISNAHGIPYIGTIEPFLVAARAAIEAMREPTEGQVAAGIASVDTCADGWTARAPCTAEHAWEAMIDAALAEGTEAATT